MFFLSVDVVLGKEALVVLMNLTLLMVEKSRNSFHTYVIGLTVGS